MTADTSDNPRKPLADSLSAKVWSEAVAIASELSPGQIEVRFMPECVKRVDGQLSRPKLMDRYAEGKLTPKRGKRKCGGLKLVERIEAHYPGTARWLLHPFWDLLKPDNYSLGKLHSLMLGIDSKLSRFFFIDMDHLDGLYVRNYNIQPKVIRSLWKHPSLDTFALLLGLLREAEIKADMPSHHCACSSMLRMFPEIAELQPIKPIAGELFDYIENSFFKVIYTDLGGEEMYFNDAWREKYRHLAKQYQETLIKQLPLNRRYILSPIAYSGKPKM